jgi:hypothetical protein
MTGLSGLSRLSGARALAARVGVLVFAALAEITALTPVTAFAPQRACAGPDEPFRWYGIGGELTTTFDEPRRWLGRIGLTEDVGAEILFAMQHTSGECRGEGADCDYTRIDVGTGVIYDVAPGALLTPYLAGRFVLSTIADGDDQTLGIIEAAGGVEYAAMKRVGLSAELNFSMRTDPTQVLTSTRVRFYFYF